MQAHFDGKEFKFYSRNGSDFTGEFGSKASDSTKFAHPLATSLAPDVRSVILDGEICAWDHQTQTLIQKSERNDIRNIKHDHKQYQQCLVVYDICYLNGKVLTNLPLRERIPIYQKTVRPQPGRVQFSVRSVVKNKAEVIDSLNEAVDRREEGLVLKDPDSVYKPNARSGGGWIKLKPEYQNQLMDQLDLLVLGGYFGSGKGSGKIGNFLLGLADRSGTREKFLTFCKVASGYTVAELADLVTECGRSDKTPDADIVVGKEKPDVWYDPRKTPVLQVNAAEIIYSKSFTSGCTLRFPRVESIRKDKDFTNCTTVEELERLKEIGDGKLFGKLKDGDSATPRKRLKVDTGPVLGAAFRHKDYSNEKIETFNLKGKVLVVEPGKDVALKHRLERIVVKHGGKVEQNARKDRTSCYVQTAGTVKAKNIIQQGVIDVVKYSWLLDCEHEFR